MLTALALDSNTHTLLITTTDCGVQVTFYPENFHQPILHCVTNGSFYYVTHQYNSTIAWAATATVSQPKQTQANLMQSPDPSIDSIGDPRNLNNFLPDSGATQHMTPGLADLQDMVWDQKLGVEVADGHVIKCSSTGNIVIAMQDDNGVPFEATLQDVVYVPGWAIGLFSLTKFAKHGQHALIKNNPTILYFGEGAGESGHPVTITQAAHATLWPWTLLFKRTPML